jgi:hypothetical protein
MTNDVVGVALEQDVRKVPRHPRVERVMQVDVGEQRRDHSLNAKGNFRFDRTVVDWCSGFVLDLRRKE